MSKYIDKEAQAGSASESEHESELEQLKRPPRQSQTEATENENESESEAEATQSESEGSVEPEELSDEDLDLLEENLLRSAKRSAGAGGAGKAAGRQGSAQFKRLRRRAVEDSEEEAEVSKKGTAAALDKMFDEDEQEDEQDDAQDDEQDSEESDLDDFIEDDEASEGDEDELPDSLDAAARYAAKNKTKTASIPRRRAIVDESSTTGRAGSGPKKFLSAALAAGQISREAWEEMMEIFGDGSEYADLVIDSDAEEEDDDEEAVKAAEAKEANSAAIQSKMAALSLDLPERFADLPVASQNEDFSEEADWIARKLTKSRPVDSFTGLSAAVASVLRFFHVHGLEVPFIATYRKEYFSAFFGMNELWQIWDEDAQWRSLQALKGRIDQSAFQLTGEEDEIQLNIINEHLMAQKRQKGSAEAAAKFAFTACMTPEELVRFIRVGDLPARRLLNRTEFDSAAFDAQDSLGQASIEAVIKVATGAVIAQLADEPSILAVLRAMLLDQALLTVTPTPLGQIEISHDPSHPLAPIQFVTKKPLSSFTEDAGLILCRGIEGKLITVELEYPANPLDSLFVDDSFNAQVIKTCWTQHWAPRLHQIALQKLKTDSASWTAHFIQFALQVDLMKGALPVAEVEDDEPAIVAVCRLPASMSTEIQFIALNRTGRLLEQKRFKDDSSAQVDSIVRLCRDLRPLQVVVGGEGSEVLDLHHELRRRLKDQMNVDWAITNDTARLFKNSKRAAREFPESSQLFRMTVGAARRTLNPLLAFAELDAEELLALQIHPLQAQVPAPLRLKHLQRALISVINLLGVPVNELDGPGQKIALLRYVAGLGDLKAAALVNKGLASKPLLSRAELVTSFSLGRKVFTNCAGFIRISAMKAKRGKSRVAPEEPLDATRIHPESYDLARKMAADALELDDATTLQRKQDIFGSDDDDEAGADENRFPPKRDDKRDKEAINLIMADPKRLDDLLLDEYAREIERLRHLPKHLTLLDIKSELQIAYPDPRDDPPATLESASEVMKCLTGREESWWWRGRPLKARLSAPGRARLLEANDFEVRIASQTKTSAPANATLTAYLIHYDAGRFSVEISLQKQNEAATLAASSSIHFDPFYDFNRAKQQSSSSNAKASATVKPSSTSSAITQVRHLSHPAFKAVTRAEAEALLEAMPVGEPLLRPSSQRRQLAPQIASELTLSWRLAPEIHQHLPLGEADRPVGQDWLLGRSLFLPAISSRSAAAIDRFEDVDEIVARRLEPVLGLLQEAQACPKYFESHGSLDAVKAHLRSQSAANPARIPYCISLGVGSHAGSLLLSHPGGHEVIGVDPRGFLLHCSKEEDGEKCFERIEGLVEYFKRNYKEFERRSLAARETEGKEAREDPRNKYQQFA